MEALQLGGIFIAGIVSFFSPCILPVIPVFISTLLTNVDDKPIMIGKFRLNHRALLRVSLFVLGLSTIFVTLGFAFGAIGSFFNANQDTMLIVSGIIVILFGIYQTGLIKIPFLMKEKKVKAGKKREGYLGAFILGLTFSLGWTPCIGPILSAVLALTASQGSIALGGAYMAVYSLGMLIPFLVITIFSDILLSKIKGIYKHMKKIKIVGGIILIIMGILLLTNSLHLLTF
ncbi:MAG: cytochrome C biogenesis protein [Clostridia bacterium]|jgi:cytochrome c-type biogenesis protein|nr:cytochrome C biogenesis protein [Clostridia bacterium]